jgi:tape measure domain-containing protein
MVFDVSGFISNAEKVANKLNKIKVIASPALDGVTNRIVGAELAFRALDMAAGSVRAVLRGIASEVQHGFGLAMAAESAETQFRVLLSSGEKAKKLMKDINSFALATPFTVAGTMESTQKLLGAGVAPERLMSTMRMLGEISGGNTERLGLMAHTYGEVMSKGRVLSSEMNQIAASGVNMRNALAKEAGVSVAGLSKAIENGKVSAVHFHNALNALAKGKYFGSLEEGAKTLEGSLNRLKEVRDSFSRDVALGLSKKWGITESANDVANFAEGLKTLTPVVVDAFAQMGNSLLEFVDNMRALKLVSDHVQMVAINPFAGVSTTQLRNELAGINTKRDLQNAAGIVKNVGAAANANKPPLPSSQSMTDWSKVGNGLSKMFGSIAGSDGASLLGGIGGRVGNAFSSVGRGFSADFKARPEPGPTGALVAGSSEAFHAIINAMTGRDKEATAKASLAELKAISGAATKTVESLGKIAEKLTSGVIASFSGG